MEWHHKIQQNDPIHRQLLGNVETNIIGSKGGRRTDPFICQMTISFTNEMQEYQGLLHTF